MKRLPCVAGRPEHELIVRLGSMLDEMVQRKLSLLHDVEEERRRAEAATERAERLARRLRELGVDPDEP